MTFMPVEHVDTYPMPQEEGPREFVARVVEKRQYAWKNKGGAVERVGVTIDVFNASVLASSKAEARRLVMREYQPRARFRVGVIWERKSVS